jgi:pimeloyl-ACP methyl ester carboxylesterase
VKFFICYTQLVPAFQTTDGVRLHFKDWGEGQAVVFLHAYALQSDAWAYQMDFLMLHGFRCIAYDRRGHGRSDCPASGYDYDTLANDLAAVLDHLDLNGVVLVGHSMGAGEIVRFFKKYGSARAAGAILVAPNTPFMIRTDNNPAGLDPSILDHLDRAISADYPQTLRFMADGLWGDDEKVSPDMKEWVYQLGLQTSLIAARACLQTAWRSDFRSDLAAIDVPTLVIQGDCDKILPLHLSGRPTVEAIPGARLAIYETAGHAIPLNQRDRLNQDLLDFLTTRI